MSKSHQNAPNDINGINATAPFMLPPNLKKQTKKVVRASGNYLEFDDGQKIFDSTSGAAVACIGHGNKRVEAAAVKQMQSISYCQTFWFATEPGEELCKFLVDSASPYMSKAYIVNSGSEANEAALKLARQYFLEKENPEPQRVNYIARRQSYHGMTIGALSLSGITSRRAPFEDILMKNVSRVSACNHYRGVLDGETIEEYVRRLAKELDDEFKRVGPETVAAFIAEPVVGAALGAMPAVPGYLRAMKEVCTKHGALFILDEVMCGMGRTGTIHAWQQHNVQPDIQTFGKGMSETLFKDHVVLPVFEMIHFTRASYTYLGPLTGLAGGYAPAAGMLINHKVIKGLEHGSSIFVHTQTYQGHATTCAVALEVQKIIQEEDLLSNVEKMGDALGKLLHDELDSHPHVGNVRGHGLFWGIEFVKEKASKSPFDLNENIAWKIHGLALEEPYNISLLPATGSADDCIRGDHVILAPAYNITLEDVDLIVHSVAAVIEDFFQEFHSAA